MIIILIVDIGNNIYGTLSWWISLIGGKDRKRISGYFLSVQNILCVLENMPVDTNVTFVSAKDLDTGINGFVTYAMSPSTEVPFMVFPDGTIKNVL
jgi:hypothetical protein